MALSGDELTSIAAVAAAIVAAFLGWWLSLKRDGEKTLESLVVLVARIDERLKLIEHRLDRLDGAE